MGYYIYSYGIQTNEILSVFGSNDAKTLESIKKTETFDNFRDFLPKGMKTSPAKALEDIIKGAPYDAKSNYAYGYALISICAALGKELPYAQEIKLGYETDLIEKYLAEDFNVCGLAVDEALFTEDSTPFDIPSIDDWPMIGWLGRDRLVALDRRLGHIKVDVEKAESLLDDGDSEEDEDKGCAYLHIGGMIENIQFCIANHLEMISFCH